MATLVACGWQPAGAVIEKVIWAGVVCFKMLKNAEKLFRGPTKRLADGRTKPDKVSRSTRLKSLKTLISPPVHRGLRAVHAFALVF